MINEPPQRSCVGRRLALAGIGAAGVISIVASGGAGPPDCLLCGGTQEPRIALSVGPSHQGVQVGETAEFYAFAAPNAAASGPMTYAWCSSPGGVGPCLEIAGARDFKLVVRGANLADDGTVFGVTVHGVNASASAQGTLYVSNTPPVSYADGEFLPQDWSASASAGAASAPAPAIARAEAGGNPGAFRRVSQPVPATKLEALYFHESRTVVYDPAAQGVLYGIEFACDFALLVPLGPDVGFYSIGVSALVVQGGRKYWTTEMAWAGPPYMGSSWVAAAGARMGLPRQQAENFQIIEGPPCGPFEACPDFSARGLPLHFGYTVFMQLPYGAAGAPALEYGVDNFRVTVWRR